MGSSFQIALNGQKQCGFLLFTITLSNTFSPSAAVQNIKAAIFLSSIFFTPDISFAFPFDK